MAEWQSDANRRIYFFSERAIQTLWRMLSILAPCKTCEEFCELVWEEFWNADGRLDIGPKTGECGS